MKTLYVNYTPIPTQVPRQLAIDILHSHGEVITLNPLVLEYTPIKPPRDAPNDEYYSTWYEITQRIHFIPGIGKMGTSKVSFKGVFHDMPWGIQTHMYVPMGIELRHKWHVRGNQPNEPPEPRELGSKAPSTGLYLQENVEITCNPLTVSFVKKELKAASKVMIDRMMQKAELLDSGVLQALFEDGKLKTINPADKSALAAQAATSPNSTMRWRPDSMVSGSRESSYVAPQPSTNPYGVPNPSGPGLAIEMLGDTHFAHPGPNQNAQRTQRGSTASELLGDSPQDSNSQSRYSHLSSEDTQSQVSSNHSRPSSFYPSPKPDHQKTPNIASELPTPYQHQTSSTPPVGPGSSRYNPQDYSRFSGPRYA